MLCLCGMWESVPAAARPRVARAVPSGHYYLLNAGVVGATVIKLPTPPGLLLRRLAPTPPKEHVGCGITSCDKEDHVEPAVPCRCNGCKNMLYPK